VVYGNGTRLPKPEAKVPYTCYQSIRSSLSSTLSSTSTDAA
jgi:hypothetical protein